MQQVGTWLSLVERTLGVGEVASSNLVVPTISLPFHPSTLQHPLQRTRLPLAGHVRPLPARQTPISVAQPRQWSEDSDASPRNSPSSPR